MAKRRTTTNHYTQRTAPDGPRWIQAIAAALTSLAALLTALQLLLQ